MNNISLTQDQIITLVSERFESNPRIKALFDKKDNCFKDNVRNLISYCFTLAYRLNGVFIASNQKTIIFHYEKKRFNQTIEDLFRYSKVILGIKLSKIYVNMRRERIIKKSRLSFPNYIYVWFLAQEKGYGRLDGLIEIQHFLFSEAIIKNLPILLETSNEDVVKLYQRASFKIYNEMIVDNETIYFLFADVDTASNFMQLKRKA